MKKSKFKKTGRPKKSPKKVESKPKKSSKKIEPKLVFPIPATSAGKEIALQALAYRRANCPKPIDNASLYAGSPMYFYCKSCGDISDVLPECYIGMPNKLCRECTALKELGWLE